ncbi:DUF72 domain-containing protein [bacterium]|nr:DUF72 domain-containing protein [bacterium]
MTIKLGTSGFSFKDWRGAVYPDNLKQEDTLRYYQNELGFDCVEINSTYYSLLSGKSFAAMERKTDEGFEFVVKAFRGITHDPFDKRLADKKPSIEDAISYIDKFIYSVHPIREKDKLGAVLLQFPVFFYPGSQSADYIYRCKERFAGIPLVIEFRNKAWARTETFEFLRENGLSYCAVDEPKLPRLMPFINEVCSDIGYIRFHGRNSNWFNSSVEERYNYLYTQNELMEFLPEINKMEKAAKKAYIFFNNCHGGFAVKNALALLKLLEDKADRS